VVDWTTFWGMFQNWVWVFSVLMDNRKEKGKMTSTVREQLIWLQIEPDIINGKIGKVWPHSLPPPPTATLSLPPPPQIMHGSSQSPHRSLPLDVGVLLLSVQLN